MAGAALALTGRGTGARAQDWSSPQVRPVGNPFAFLPIEPSELPSAPVAAPGERAVALPGALPGAELEVVDLWPGTPPGAGGPNAVGYRFDEARDGVITAVERPCLLVMRPEAPNGAAVIVAAGGGYKRIDIGHEGIPVGAWLAKSGVTAFVLVYRLPGEGWGAGPDAPRQDAQRALRLVRAGAEDYGIDPERIGLLGFSAGGHLMGAAAVALDAPLYDPVDDRDLLPIRPRLAGLIYPVITMMPPFDRTISSRRVLIGANPTEAQRIAYSVDASVGARTPPVFLAGAADDAIAMPDHSLRMFSALRAASIPAELHVFERGGHGFGLGIAGTPAAAWPTLFLAWMRRRLFLRA